MPDLINQQTYVRDASGTPRLVVELEPDEPTESVAMEAERIINGVRRDTYGPVEESFQRIADGWSSILQRTVTPVDVAAMMVWLKLCREIGGKHHRDNLTDICGYTLLWDLLTAE